MKPQPPKSAAALRKNRAAKAKASSYWGAHALTRGCPSNDLLDVSVVEATRRDYQRRYDNVVNMTQRIGVAFISVIALDCALAHYFDELWKEGANIMVAE